MSALTGESLPVDKGLGDEVLAGSLNQFGALTIDARRVAEHTVAGRVIEMTARALKDKAPLERTADRLARYFLPAVLALAALTFLVCLVGYGTGWIRPPETNLSFRQLVTLPALSVLVVACPCALILATPATIIAGSADELMLPDKYADVVRGVEPAVGVRILPGLKHMDMLHAPAAIDAASAAFAEH